MVLNSPDGWFEIHRESGIFSGDSGLIVVSGRLAELSGIAAAAYMAMQFRLRRDNGESRFKKTVLLIPPGQKADELRAATLTDIQVEMQEAGISDLMVKVLAGLCDARSLISLSGIRLVEVVGELPSDSACIIFCPELYRVAASGQRPPDDQPRRLPEISREHLESLLSELAQVARNNKVMLVLMCGKASVNIAEIVMPDEIRVVVMENPGGDSDHLPPFDLAPLLAAFRDGGWPAVHSHEGFNADDAKHIAFSLSEALGMERNLPLAWAAIEPYIDLASELTVGSQLCIAGAALTAGNMEASHELFMQAAREEIQAAEDLFSALQLADALIEPELFQKMLLQMRCSFPDIELTQRAEYLHLFKQRDFEAALKIAENLGLTDGIVRCKAFASQSIHAEEFLAEMQKQGELEQGIMSCAEEALFRHHACQAIAWARRIPEDHSLFERACAVRFRALRTAFRKGAQIFCTKELTALMRIVAARPDGKFLRSELERLLDFGLEEPLVKVTLEMILSEALEKQALVDDESISRARSIRKGFDFNAGAQTESEYEAFLEGFQETMFNGPEREIQIGLGKLDQSLLPMVGAKMLRWMSVEVVDGGLRNHLDSATICQHAICLVCNEVGDPDTDFTVLQCIIDYQSSMGAAQEMRDFADTALRFWPQSQPAFLAWRISQGWAALAEACLRSKNKMAALRYLCLSLLAHEEPALNVELLRRWYRMASRIFRDLHVSTLAFRCIALEKDLLSKINSSVQDASLDVLELQILLPTLMASSLEMQLSALGRSEELAQMRIEGELYPLVAIQASILRLIPDEHVPLDILKNFRERVDSVPEALQITFRATSAKKPTKEEIAAIIEAVPEAQDHHYLAYQITPSLPAFANALRSAVDSGDKELFFMAAGPFAQPSLGVQIAGSPPRDAKPAEASSTIFRTTTLEGLSSRTFEQVQQFSFARLASISIEQLQGCLMGSEVVQIIASEPGSHPLGMLVSRDSVSSPGSLSSWSLDSFAKWKWTHKEKLEWFKPAGFVPGLDSLEPPVQVIKEVVENLSLGLNELPDKLTILPPAHLFGFSWGLSPHNGGFLAEHTSLAIAPSAAWLVASRTSTWSGSPARKAWIGSAETTDNTLIVLRSYVEDCLKEHQFLVSRDFAPSNFSRCELAFIGAHGGTGMGGFFRSVSDRVNHFSPSELAQMLAGCGCVILAVCSGGRSDRQSGSEETLGLVTALFRAGVRCVIAPPWPLDIDVVKYWLPAFLRALDAGATTGEAAVKARDAVRQELDHPCAWGQMHLYGDQNFRLKTASPLPSEPMQ